MIRLGTRGSALALAQARMVAAALGDEECEIVEITTSGDRGAGIGDKSRWVDAIEAALLDGRIDIAVHSAKDVPGELADGLALVGALPREDARDVLAGAPSLDALPEGARVGTSSLRRRAQVLAARADLEVLELRGNVDTRLRKLADGEADAIVLAAAGLVRLGRADAIAGYLAHVPAPGQGVVALETREADADALGASARVSDERALAELGIERAVCAALGATCHTPVGVRAERAGDATTVRTFAGLPDGSEWIADEVTDVGGAPAAVVERALERLLSVGIEDLLRRAEGMAVA